MNRFPPREYKKKTKGSEFPDNRGEMRNSLWLRNIRGEVRLREGNSPMRLMFVRGLRDILEGVERSADLGNIGETQRREIGWL